MYFQLLKSITTIKEKRSLRRTKIIKSTSLKTKTLYTISSQSSLLFPLKITKKQRLFDFFKGSTGTLRKIWCLSLTSFPGPSQLQQLHHFFLHITAQKKEVLH